MLEACIWPADLGGMLTLGARPVAPMCPASKQVTPQAQTRLGLSQTNPCCRHLEPSRRVGDPQAQNRLGLTAVTQIPVAGTLSPADKQVTPQARIRPGLTAVTYMPGAGTLRARRSYTHPWCRHLEGPVGASLSEVVHVRCSENQARARSSHTHPWCRHLEGPVGASLLLGLQAGPRVQEQTHLPAHAPLAAGGTNDQRVSLQDSLQGTTTRVSVHSHWACGVDGHAFCLWCGVEAALVQLVGECCTRAASTACLCVLKLPSPLKSPTQL